MAKATHSERTSERVEARVPQIAKVLVREDYFSCRTAPFDDLLMLCIP